MVLDILVRAGAEVVPLVKTVGVLFLAEVRHNLAEAVEEMALAQGVPYRVVVQDIAEMQAVAEVAEEDTTAGALAGTEIPLQATLEAAVALDSCIQL